MDIARIFLLFMIYSVCGWVIEVIDLYFVDKKIVNRGFFIGPYCPIYGFGSLLIIFLLTEYMHQPLALFMMAILICATLEYSASYILEMIFKTRWWDYSNKKYNINGRICLETLIPFGIGGCLVLYFVNPFLTKRLLFLSDSLVYGLAIIIALLFIIDMTLSFKVVSNFKVTAARMKKDSTEQINHQIKQLLFEKSALSKRLVKAFPNLRLMFMEKVTDLKIKLRKKD